MSLEGNSAGAPSRARLFLGHGWRMCVGLAVGLVLFMLTYEAFSPDSPADVRAVGGYIALDMVCGLAALVIYPFRHRFPLVVTAVLVVLSFPSTLATGFTLLAIISLATHRRPVQITAASLLLIIAGMLGDQYGAEALYPQQEPLIWWQSLVAALVATLIPVLVGLIIGGRRQLAESHRRQLHAVQGERDAQIQAAKADERTRLAREMHDVLAHRLSLVALHSGALEYRNDLSPEQTKTTAGIIRENSHLALGELREVLGMLRDPHTLFADELARPQPALGELESILSDSRAVGTPVELHLDAETRARMETLPTSTGRHLYRIVQEALTNARRHAPGCEVRLAIDGHRGDSLHLRAENRLCTDVPAPPGPQRWPASGLGLNGLAERVRLAGGRLHIDPDDAGSFVLQVWLPWAP
ncbi:MAG: histidine kinase [Micrococcaceae bacterium]|nr:histidine kinase [Micrococcaceae bacterium]